MIAAVKDIEEKAEREMEEILKSFNDLERARVFALEIATTEYSQQSSENYDQPPSGKTNEVYSEVEEFSISHLDAKKDYGMAAGILSEIKKKMDQELSKQQKIIVKNFLIRGLEAEEVNDRLNERCGIVLHRSTITRKKKEAIKKLVAKEVHTYHKEVFKLIDRYAKRGNAT